MSPPAESAGEASEPPGSEEAARASRWLDVAPNRGAPLPPDLPVHVGWLTGAVCNRYSNSYFCPSTHCTDTIDAAIEVFTTPPPSMAAHSSLLLLLLLRNTVI